MVPSHPQWSPQWMKQCESRGFAEQKPGRTPDVSCFKKNWSRPLKQLPSSTDVLNRCPGWSEIEMRHAVLAHLLDCACRNHLLRCLLQKASWLRFAAGSCTERWGFSGQIWLLGSSSHGSWLWVITPGTSGLTLRVPFITGLITHLRAVGWATKYWGCFYLRRWCWARVLTSDWQTTGSWVIPLYLIIYQFAIDNGHF
jgi:hypothetical protein